MQVNTESLISGPVFDFPDDMPVSLAAYIESLISLYPDGEFTAIDKAGLTQTKSYQQLYQQAIEIYFALDQLGDDNRTELILCFDSVLDFIPAAWACILGGYTWVPWSTSELVRNSEGFMSGFQALLEKLNQPWIITDTETAFFLRLNNAYIDISQLLDIKSIKQKDLCIDAASAVYQDCSALGQVLIATSGTTGSPKLACIPNNTLLNRYFKKQSLNKVDLLYCFPLHSISGMSVLFPMGCHSIYLNPNRLASHPQELLLTIEDYQVQWFGLSSYIAAMLIDVIDRKAVKNNLSSLQGLIFGTDFIVPQLVTSIILKFQQLGADKLCISFVYGMTECGPICRIEYSAKDLLKKLANNGTALLEMGECTAGRQLKIVDDNNQLLAEGKIGNIYIYSKDYMFAGYRGNDALSNDGFSSDGWFITGDRGVVIAGKLTLTGRDNTKFKINGKSYSLQQIEAPLGTLSGIRENMIFATSIPVENRISEQLVIFFVPIKFDDALLNTLTNQIIREIANHNQINIKHLIAIDVDDIERTGTGKIQRHLMAEQYSQGKWQNLIVAKPVSQNQNTNAIQSYLLVLWQEILKLEMLPDMDESFFLLGGDSLAAAILISELEEKYNGQLSLNSFYKKPTITTLAGLLQNIESATAHKVIKPSRNNNDLLHKIETYVDSWYGDRLFEKSLLVGMNTQGRNRPIIWVFQSYDELQALADKLGPNQPLYGLRSSVNIIKISDYTEANLQPLINRYLWEILALSVEHPVVLAGNCQGGIIALALAKILKQIGKAPALLVLMEWMYAYGIYTDSVLFLYGENSQTAGIYMHPETANIDWRHDFPKHQVMPISGAHGEFFMEPNIQSLALVLDKYISVL